MSCFITLRLKKWYNEDFIENNENTNYLDLELGKIINNIEIIPLINYLIITREYGKNNKPHYHIILSFKNIIGYNKEFIYNLKNNLIECLDEQDITIDLLTKFIEYKNRFNYMSKEKPKLNLYLFYSKEFESIHLSLLDINITSKIIENEWSNFGSYSNINNIYDEFTLINLINFYFYFKKCYISNDIIYKKIYNANISYRKYDSLKNLPNLIVDIYQELLTIFHIQLKNLDIYMLKIKYFFRMEQLIEKTSQIIINKIELKFDIIEFKDGIYFLSKNKFIPNKIVIRYNFNNIGTIKFYNKTYKNLKSPNEWKSLIENTLNNNEESKELFEYFSTLFNKNDDLLGKKRIIYVKGGPSTGKTMLLTKIIYNFFGEDNVGTISGNSNFSLENLLYKELAVIDEAEHLKLNKGFLLKITELYNPQTIDRKYKKSIILKNLRLIFLSNNELNIKDKLIKEAFEKRIRMFEFTKQLPIEVETYKKIIDMIVKEEINIIIYCNQLFFENYIYKVDKKPKIKSDKIIKKLLES